MTLYFTHEVGLMLERAGFSSIELYGDYTREGADPRFGVRRVRCREDRLIAGRSTDHDPADGVVRDSSTSAASSSRVTSAA